MNSVGQIREHVGKSSLLDEASVLYSNLTQWVIAKRKRIEKCHLPIVGHKILPNFYAILLVPRDCVTVWTGGKLPPRRNFPLVLSFCSRDRNFSFLFLSGKSTGCRLTEEKPMRLHFTLHWLFLTLCIQNGKWHSTTLFPYKRGLFCTLWPCFAFTLFLGTCI